MELRPPFDSSFRFTKRNEFRHKLTSIGIPPAVPPKYIKLRERSSQCSMLSAHHLVQKTEQHVKVFQEGESNTLKISQRESIIRLSRAIPHERS